MEFTMNYFKLFLFMTFSLSLHHNTALSMKRQYKPEILNLALLDAVELKKCTIKDIKHLLEGKHLNGYSANPNIKDKDGFTPLFWATYYNNQDVITFLIKHNADPNIKDGNGFTPLHVATSSDDEKVVELLLEYNADPTIQDSEGLNSFHIASKQNNPTILKKLLSKIKNSIDNFQTMHKKNRLNYLCTIKSHFFQNQAFTFMLCIKKSKTKIPRQILYLILLTIWQEEHPHDYCSQIWHGNGHHILKDQINSLNYEGETPLAIAIKKGYPKIKEIIETFLKKNESN